MRRLLLGSLFLILALFLVACGGTNESTNDEASDGEVASEEVEVTTTSEDGLPQMVNLTWASGPQGGVWYGAAGGLSSLLKGYDKNLNIKTIPGGTVQNVAFVESGESDLSWNMAFFANSAMDGEAPFDKEHNNFSAISSGLGDSTFHFVINADNEYESIEEIFEKGNIKIALSPPAGSDDFIFQKIMEFYDTSYEEMEKNGVSFFQGDYTEQAEQFKNSNVDVIFALSGLPGSSITDASISRDLKLLEFPDDLKDFLTEHAFVEKTIPAGTYEKAVNGDEDIKTMTAQNVILVNNDVPEDVVYEITKGINENKDSLKSIHAALTTYDLDIAADNLGDVKIHPGAEKYYKEVGVME